MIDLMPSKLFKVTLKLNGKKRQLIATMKKSSKGLYFFTPHNKSGDIIEKPKGRNEQGVPIVETELIVTLKPDVLSLVPLYWSKHYGMLSDSEGNLIQ